VLALYGSHKACFPRGGAGDVGQLKGSRPARSCSHCSKTWTTVTSSKLQAANNRLHARRYSWIYTWEARINKGSGLQKVPHILQQPRGCQQKTTPPPGAQQLDAYCSLARCFQEQIAISNFIISLAARGIRMPRSRQYTPAIPSCIYVYLHNERAPMDRESYSKGRANMNNTAGKNSQQGSVR
jgi:hypothetical protein